MNDKYDPDSLIMAIEEAENLRNQLSMFIYESTLEPIYDLVRQASIAKQRIDELEKTQ